MLLPSEVKSAAAKLEDANIRFRTFLKNRADDDKLDAQFLEFHKELFASNDCCKCNNCCKAYKIIVENAEIPPISAFLGLSETDFIAEYLTEYNDEGEEKHCFKSKPCTFLGNDGRCRIQSCKPAVCKGYPYNDEPDRLLSIYSILESVEVCPVVFEILERLKVIYRFKNRA